MNITGAATTEAIISVENGGALNVANGGTLRLTRNTDDNGINPYAGVTIKSGATCTIASGGTITTDGQVTSPYYQFVVNGSMTVAGAFTTLADVAVNAGGSLTIAGTLKAAYGIANSGTITLNGIDNVPVYASGYPTTITNSDTGVVKLTSTGNVNDSAKDYSTIKGTGVLKYSGTGYRTLPYKSGTPAKYPATTLTFENEQTDGGLVVHQADIVIGSLKGSGNFRSDWSGATSSSQTHSLVIKQSKDTTWSGVFQNEDRLASVTVDAGDDSVVGTLTISGDQVAANASYTTASHKQDNALIVNGSVNLTGTWVGATTVSGTFGGTGTLTGNLTFNAGATFKAFASDTDGLAVSGTVTCPAEGTVTVDVSALEQTGTKVLMTASGLDVSKFALAGGQSGTLSVADGALKVSFTTYVAEYGGIQYETVQEAINAAIADGHSYADVTILDATAECPAGYYVDTENSNALTKYQAAIVKMDESKVYFKTAQLAFDDIAANANLVTYMQGYVCVEVYYGTDVAISINASATIWAMGVPVKIRCLDSATVSVTTTATESTLTAGAADENGIVTYTKADIATTYVWAGGTTQGPWSNPNKWKVGTLEGATATRKPGALDTVQIGDGAKVTDIVGSLNVAALQVSGTVTFAGGGTLTSASAITLGANDSIVITGTLSPVPTTTVADSYVKATTSDKTTTYVVDTYKTVTITGSNMTATRTDTLGTAIKDGDTITFTIAPAEGYVVTGVAATLAGGSSETLTANNGVYSYVVNGNVMIAVTAAQVATVAEPSFEVYYADYSKAQTVTLAVSDYVEDSVYTLQVGNGAAVTGEYDSTAQTVTFRNVEGFTPGAAVNYTITVSGAAAGTKSGTVTAAAPAVSGWVSETKTTIGTASATGTWSPNAPTFGDADSAALSGETTFTARAQASGKVTLTTVVNFGNEAAPTIEIGADAKAAIKVENNSFKIWTKTTSEGGTGATADWLTVSGAEPDLAADSTVVFTFDTDAKTFTASVGGAALYYGESNANTSFAFASDGVAISSVAYKGAGSFTSLTGEYTTTDVTTSVDGKQVVVANSFISGNAALRAMTVAEAAAALAPDSAATCGNGLNYFKCYALGLDPTKTDDKPIVDVTTDAEGKFVFTVKHPVYNAQGEIIGYEEINAADNVSTAITLKYGNGADALTSTAATNTIAPSELPFGENNNVLYYKAEVSISAK